MVSYFRNTFVQTWIHTTLEQFSSIIFAFCVYTFSLFWASIKWSLFFFFFLDKITLWSFVTLVIISNVIARRSGNDSVVLTVQSEKCITLKIGDTSDMHVGFIYLLSVVNVCWKQRSLLKVFSLLLCICSFLTDLSVMVRQVNTVLCSEVGSYSTTHCCLYDQSVPTTGKVLFFVSNRKFCFVLYTEGEKGPVSSGDVVIPLWFCFYLFLDFRNLWWDNSVWRHSKGDWEHNL